MKTLKVLICILVIFSFTNSFFKVYGQSNSELINMLKEKTSSQEKKDALTKLYQLNEDKKLNPSLTKEYSCLIYFAKNNIKAIDFAIDLTTKSIRNSDLFLCIAKTAANSENETTFYNNLLELTSLKLAETEKMINNSIKEMPTLENNIIESKIKTEINQIKSKPGFESQIETL